MGPFTAVYITWKNASVESKEDIGDDMLWILAIGGAGIVVGLAMYGYKIITAIGVKLTAITPSRGYCIELGSALVVIYGTSQVCERLLRVTTGYYGLLRVTTGYFSTGYCSTGSYGVLRIPTGWRLQRTSASSCVVDLRGSSFLFDVLRRLRRNPHTRRRHPPPPSLFVGLAALDHPLPDRSHRWRRPLRGAQWRQRKRAGQGHLRVVHHPRRLRRLCRHARRPESGADQLLKKLRGSWRVRGHPSQCARGGDRRTSAQFLCSSSGLERVSGRTEDSAQWTLGARLSSTFQFGTVYRST